MNDNIASVFLALIICTTIGFAVADISSNLEQRRFVAAGYHQQTVADQNGRLTVIWTRPESPPAP